ncbi:MAG: hypothetical protein VXZ40_00215 [Nanoarchaeota archaeon]|nr:hypothetical protein [Nanoarchaeota archaeon]
MRSKEDIKADIDKQFKLFEKEYLELGTKSEKLDQEQQILEEKYKQLDEKSGLNKLFEELAELEESLE